jgi:hypothetical protein
MYDTRKEAEDVRRLVAKADKRLNNLEIRKVKVIDIGEVNES